jgi:hypothetical protein
MNKFVLLALGTLIVSSQAFAQKGRPAPKAEPAKVEGKGGKGKPTNGKPVSEIENLADAKNGKDKTETTLDVLTKSQGLSLDAEVVKSLEARMTDQSVRDGLANLSEILKPAVKNKRVNTAGQELGATIAKLLSKETAGTTEVVAEAQRVLPDVLKNGRTKDFSSLMNEAMELDVPGMGLKEKLIEIARRRTGQVMTLEEILACFKA